MKALTNILSVETERAVVKGIESFIIEEKGKEITVSLEQSKYHQEFSAMLKPEARELIGNLPVQKQLEISELVCKEIAE